MNAMFSMNALFATATVSVLILAPQDKRVAVDSQERVAIDPEDGRVAVAPSSVPQAIGELTTRLYDVSDLLDPNIRWFIPESEERAKPGELPRPGGSRRPGGPDESEGRDDAEGRIALQTEALAELVADFIEPPLSAEGGVHAMVGGAIVTLLTAEQHVWLEDFLVLQRSHAHEVYQLSVNVLSAEPGRLARSNAGPDGEPWVLDTPNQRSEFLERLKKDSRAELLSSPQVLLYPRQRGNVSILREIAYVADYEMHKNVYPGDQMVLAPVIDVVQEGIVIDAKVVRTGLDHVAVDFALEHSDVTEPIALFQTTIEGHPVEIALPEVALRRVESRAALVSGSTLVYPAFEHEDREIAVLVNVEVLQGLPR